MTGLWDLFLTAAFVDNMPLTLFLGQAVFMPQPDRNVLFRDLRGSLVQLICHQSFLFGSCKISGL